MKSTILYHGWFIEERDSGPSPFEAYMKQRHPNWGYGHHFTTLDLAKDFIDRSNAGAGAERQHVLNCIHKLQAEGAE